MAKRPFVISAALLHPTSCAPSSSSLACRLRHFSERASSLAACGAFPTRVGTRGRGERESAGARRLLRQLHLTHIGVERHGRRRRVRHHARGRDARCCGCPHLLMHGQLGARARHQRGSQDREGEKHCLGASSLRAHTEEVSATWQREKKKDANKKENPVARETTTNLPHHQHGVRCDHRRRPVVPSPHPGIKFDSQWWPARVAGTTSAAAP